MKSTVALIVCAILLVWRLGAETPMDDDVHRFRDGGLL